MNCNRVGKGFLEEMGFHEIKMWDGDEERGTDDGIFGVDGKTQSGLVFPFSMTAAEAIKKIQASRASFGV